MLRKLGLTAEAGRPPGSFDVQVAESGFSDIQAAGKQNVARSQSVSQPYAGQRFSRIFAGSQPISVVGSPLVLRRQPAPAVEWPKDTEETRTRIHYSGSVANELRDELSDLADKGVTDFAPYKKALQESVAVQRRNAYLQSDLLVRLAATLPLASFDQCISLLAPDGQTRILAAKIRIKQKFGLGQVSEEGAKWSESELAIVDRNFDRLKEDRELLRGLDLIRKDHFAPEIRHGKSFTINARTSETEMRLTSAAIHDPLTILHEAGHLIQEKQADVRLAELDKSPTFTNLRTSVDQLRQANSAATKAGDSNPEFVSAFNEMSKAIQAVLDSTSDSMQNAQDQLQLAESAADVAQSKEHSKAMLESYDRLKAYARSVEQYAPEKEQIKTSPAAIEKMFIELVKKHRLATSSFRPFDDYVSHSWPDKPQEFLVQCYSTWRNDPSYLKDRAPALFDWFQNGGHLGKTTK